MINTEEIILSKSKSSDLVSGEAKLEQPVIEEKTVSARLVLTSDQAPFLSSANYKKGVGNGLLLDQYTNERVEFAFINIKMEKTNGTLSGTAVYSDLEKEEKEDLEELKYLPKLNEVHAKLIFTEEQEKDLLEAFNLLDYTGEGKIKAEDFRVAIKALGYEPTKEELQKMINAVDKGGTGKLSFENFETAIMRKVMAQDTDGDIMKSFRLFDMDDNGMISFKNLKNVTEILGCPLTDEEIDEMIDDADKDFDGFVSVQEFMKMIKNCVYIVTP